MSNEIGHTATERGADKQCKGRCAQNETLCGGRERELQCETRERYADRLIVEAFKERGGRAEPQCGRAGQNRRSAERPTSRRDCWPTQPDTPEIAPVGRNGTTPGGMNAGPPNSVRG